MISPQKIKINMKNLEKQKISNIDIRNGRNLIKNRGIVVFNRAMLLNDFPFENILKVIFANFFPVAIEAEHSLNMYEEIKMYGYSQHFREVEEGENAPHYKLVLYISKNEIRFDKMVELK